jgi:hypothetical protein
MRLAGRSAFQWVVIALGLALVGFAVWGLARTYPDFATERVEPARLSLPVPTPATP